MQKISILIDNNYLDLFENTDFTITKQSLILGDIGSRQMDFTSNIKIPVTEYNKTILGLSLTSNDRRNSRQYIPNVNLEFENLQIVINGYLTISSLAPDYIEISILQDLKDIVQRLSYKNLKDIRLQTTNTTYNGPVTSLYELIDYNTNTVVTNDYFSLRTAPYYNDGTYNVAPSFDTHIRYVNDTQRKKVYFRGLDGSVSTDGSKYLSWKEVFTSPIISHEEVENFEFGKMFGPEGIDRKYYHLDYMYYPNMVSTLHSVFAQVFENVENPYNPQHNGGFLVIGKVLDELKDYYFTHGAPYNYYGTNLDFKGISGNGLAEWKDFFIGSPPVNVISTPTFFVPLPTVIPRTASQIFNAITGQPAVIYTHLGANTTSISLNFTATGNVTQNVVLIALPPGPGDVAPTAITPSFQVIINHYNSLNVLITSSIDYINIPNLNTGDYITVDIQYLVLYDMPIGSASLYAYQYIFGNVQVSMEQPKYGSQLPENTEISPASLFYDMNQLDFVKEVCNTFLLSFDIDYNQEILDEANNVLGYTNTITFWRLSELLENIGSAYDWSDRIDNTRLDIPYSLLELHANDYSQLSLIDFSNSGDYVELASYNKDFLTVNYMPTSYIGGDTSNSETTISGNTLNHYNGFQIPVFVNDETLEKSSTVNSLKGTYFYDKYCLDTTSGPFLYKYSKNLYVNSFNKEPGVIPPGYTDYTYNNAEFGFLKVKNYNLDELSLSGNPTGVTFTDYSLYSASIIGSKLIKNGTLGSPLNEGKGDYFYENVTEFLKNNIFSDYQKLTLRVKLTLDEINNFKFKYPVYLAQTESYYYVEKIEGYSSKDELSTVYLIKLTIN